MLMFGKKETVSNEKQADVALAEMAAIDRKLATITVNMNEEKARIIEEAQKASDPLIERRKLLKNAIRKWATMNKSQLFAKRKTLDLAFGIVGFRWSENIQQMRGVKDEETLALLQEHSLHEGIKATLKVDKLAMNDWPEEKLNIVGLCRVGRDEFQCKPHNEQVAKR